MRFGGVKAVVTGAGRGFGTLIALALAREGADVVIAYNTSREGAEKVSGQIGSMGRKSSGNIMIADGDFRMPGA